MTSLQHAFLDGWQPTVFAALKAVARFLTAVAVGAIVGRTATAADTS